VLIAQGRQAAMGEMLGNLAHQWRQPLNALGLLLSNLKDAAQLAVLDQAEVDRSVAQGKRLVQKMSTTINEFRDFFLPDKSAVAFPGRGPLEATTGLFAASFAQRGIRVELEIVDEPILFGLPSEYSQVILHLLSNAKDAIAARGEAGGKVTLRLGVVGPEAVLSVRDDGGGIPAELLEKVFEPYFSTKKSGAGIGLYMARMIVERSLKGRIEARNVDGGAELTVLVPLAGGAS
jgi:signal transduction histidine kinase